MKDVLGHTVFMPYLILVFGLVLGIYALYRLFKRASAQQAADAIRIIFIILMLVLCFFLALTGRVIPAIAIASALIPLVLTKKPQQQNSAQQTKKEATSASSITSRQEALNILNLKDGTPNEAKSKKGTDEPSKKDIEAAYKKLMKKLHPDHGGNDYFAQKLNEARDYLLKD